jgi:hypothetical protein
VLGGEINIADSSNSIPSSIDTDPSVALEGNAGAFVVAYDHGSSVSGVSVDVAEVNSSNVVIDTFSAGQTEADGGYAPGISIDAQNEFRIFWKSCG